MNKRITIDPITRLEGHGKIEIFLNDDGDVERVFLQVPELRGFEAFLTGRPAEEMPRLTSKICGVCPTAHHICSAKALDDLYKVDPPYAAKKLRELMYAAFILEDHLLNLFFLGGPDFIAGPTAPPSERNIFGVIAKLGAEIVGKAIKLRKDCRDIIAFLGGRVIHPVCALPGGISKPVSEDERRKIMEVARGAIAFLQDTFRIFDSIVARDNVCRALLMPDMLALETYYMGMVDKQNRVSFYDGEIGVVAPDGSVFVKFEPKNYLLHVGEHVETWSFAKYPYLKNVGWRGFTDGISSGIYKVGALARMNVADGMATPLAQEEYEKLFSAIGEKPAHNNILSHRARLVEALCAAERMLELAADDGIMDTHIRNIPSGSPREGIGVVEAPRGTLIHHYKSDANGIIAEANLIVATEQNAAAMNMSAENACRQFVRKGVVTEGILNMVETVIRSYDPCLACATHMMKKGSGFAVHVINHRGEVLPEDEMS